MITKLHFENLRCFKDFTIEGMTPLTLISGRNNVGKTAFLEGVFLLFAYRSPDLFFKINNIRGIPVAAPFPPGVLMGADPLTLWETLFTDMDMTLKLQVSAKDSKDCIRTVCLEKDSKMSLVQFPGPQHPQNTLQPVPGSYILNLSYAHDALKEKGSFALTQNGLAFKLDANSSLPPPMVIFYLGPNVPFPQQQVADWFGKMEMEDKKKQIVDTLRMLDNRLVDIFVVPKHGMVDLYARWETKKTRPIRTLGDGINKLLLYMLAMFANPGCIFLLDEIETGLHYSFYPQLWELVAFVAKTTGSQVIATTHSYECIEAAKEGATRVDASLLTYVRLGRENGAIIPYVFPHDDLVFVLDREMEVR